MKKVIPFLLLTAGLLKAQDRYIISLRPQDAQLRSLEEVLTDPTIQPPLQIRTEQRVRQPQRRVDLISITINRDTDIERITDELTKAYGRNYIFTLEPRCRFNTGSPDSNGLKLEPTLPNLPLEALVPGGMIAIPTPAPLKADVLIDIMGTGVDVEHSSISHLNFASPLSVIISDSGTGFLTGNFDYHDHETRIAGCIAGTDCGLLARLGTAKSARYRSVLFYEKPNVNGPVAYLTDCIAAVSEVINAHDIRTDTPYLKNHAAVVCFAHTMEAPNTRVGALDSLFEELWELGIFTSLSAGNDAIAAAATSPAGSGEWISYYINNTVGDPVVNTDLWPPTGSSVFTSYDLPSPPDMMVGFHADFPHSKYHLKSGAHNCEDPLGLWVNSNLNTSNPTGLGSPDGNTGVDLLAPGEHINFPSTEVETAGAIGSIEVVDGTSFGVKRGYRTGSGSSYSAAFTASLAARILQLRPWAMPSQVREAILTSTSSSGTHKILAMPDFANLDPMKLTYDQWIGRYNKVASAGIYPSGLGNKMADLDDDGAINLVEYLCGMDPRYPDSQHAPVLTTDENFTTLTVTMQLAEYLDTENGADWEFETSDDLEDWTGIGKGTSSTLADETTMNGDGRNLIETRAVEYDALKRFYRMRIFETPIIP